MTDMQSEAINELAKALAIAQGQIKSASKDATNPHFKSAYATLASIWDACREPLSKNGLAVIQQHVMAEGSLQLCTTLAHSSGQWMKSYLPVIPTQNTPQGLGSAITYMRRYALGSIAGVAPDDDDDGNAGSGKETYGAPGNQRSTSPAVNQWHAAALADIGKAADMKELEKVYKRAVKHGKASGMTDDQAMMLEQQKDARKERLSTGDKLPNIKISDVVDEMADVNGELNDDFDAAMRD